MKSGQAMEQRVERLSLLRLSRVAREQGEAKHNALSIMNKKLIYRTSLNPRFSVRPDKNKNVEDLLVFPSFIVLLGQCHKGLVMRCRDSA